MFIYTAAAAATIFLCWCQNPTSSSFQWRVIWTENQWLSRNPPGLQYQTGTAEASSFMISASPVWRQPLLDCRLNYVSQSNESSLIYILNIYDIYLIYISILLVLFPYKTMTVCVYFATFKNKNHFLFWKRQELLLPPAKGLTIRSLLKSISTQGQWAGRQVQGPSPAPACSVNHGPPLVNHGPLFFNCARLWTSAVWWSPFSLLFGWKFC